MAGYTVVKKMTMGQGIHLSILHDPSQPEDSLDRWVAEGIAEGNPGDAVFFVPLHWHKKHSEHMTVFEGRVELTLGDEKRILTAGDEAVIPPYVVHGFQGFPGERLRIRERADPPGSYKAEFFADIFEQEHMNSFWYTMRAFYDGDGYAKLPLYFRFFDVAFVTILGGLAKLFLPAPKPLLKSG